MERLFTFSSLLVAPFWLLMTLLPRWRWTERIVRSPFIVAGPVLLYAVLAAPDLLRLLPLLASPELGTISSLLGRPEGALLAWAHFLAFDLFVARWIFFDARAVNAPAWVVSPLLLVTLLLGPLGLGMYLGLRAIGMENLGGFARRVWSGSRPLAGLTLGSAALLTASLILAMVDERQILGAPAWMKPAKFAAAFLVTAPVLAWIIGQMGRTRGVRTAERLIVGTSVVELFIIVLQTVRGVPSHFNNATALDATLFGVMGAAILVFWVAQGYLALRSFRHTFATPARSWGIRLGLAAALIGGASGFIMPRPTPAQLESLRAGEPTPLLGAHAVGVPDGGPGLPIARWSTEGGDLRVPHFLGLHGLQILPLLAWAVERRRRRPGRARPVVAAGVGWMGLFAITTWQALRGQPLLSPDAVTLAATAAVACVAAAILLLGRHQPHRQTGPAGRLLSVHEARSLRW